MNDPGRTAMLLADHGFDCGPAALAVVLAEVGKITAVADLPGGVVHHVARVTGSTGATVILKQRGSACWALPERPLRPADAQFEARALELLGQVRPGLAPRLLHYDAESAMIVMTDLGDDQGTSGGDFLARAAPDQAMAAIATAAVTLAAVHSQLAARFPGMVLRPDDDEEIFERNLRERIGYHGRSGTSRLVSDVRALHRQLVLGDFSPKNIRFDPAAIRVFDLEHMHSGARVFDLSFLLSHVIVHRGCGGHGRTAAEVDRAARAYQRSYPLDAASGHLLGRLVAAGILYRIRNEIVPYDVKLADDTRKRIADALLAAMEWPALTTGDVVSMASSPDGQQPNREN